MFSKYAFISWKNIFKMFGKIQSVRFPTAKTYPNFTKIGDKKVVPVLLGIMTFAAMKPERSVTLYIVNRALAPILEIYDLASTTLQRLFCRSNVFENFATASILWVWYSIYSVTPRNPIQLQYVLFHSES